MFTCHRVHMWVWGHLLPPCVSRGWSSSFPAWQQVSLAAELPHHPGKMSLHETELLSRATKPWDSASRRKGLQLRTVFRKVDAEPGTSVTYSTAPIMCAKGVTGMCQ